MHPNLHLRIGKLNIHSFHLLRVAHESCEHLNFCTPCLLIFLLTTLHWPIHCVWWVGICQWISGMYVSRLLSDFRHVAQIFHVQKYGEKHFQAVFFSSFRHFCQFLLSSLEYAYFKIYYHLEPIKVFPDKHTYTIAVYVLECTSTTYRFIPISSASTFPALLPIHIEV